MIGCRICQIKHVTETSLETMIDKIEVIKLMVIEGGEGILRVRKQEQKVYEDRRERIYHRLEHGQ